MKVLMFIREKIELKHEQLKFVKINMITFSKLTSLSLDEFMSIGNPAIDVKSKYEVTSKIYEDEILFRLKHTELKSKYSLKIYSNSNEDLERYNKLIPEGNSFGAYDENKLIGFVISEKRNWNNSLWIEMIHIAKDYKGKGIGSELLKSLENHAVSEKFRIIDIETQNTNVPAINFYRKNGYELTGLNLSLYDPEKVNGEIAIFLAKKL
jgi:ribosomal protein S18 acetylase RimI-like enzyme